MRGQRDSLPNALGCLVILWQHRKYFSHVTESLKPDKAFLRNSLSYSLYNQREDTCHLGQGGTHCFRGIRAGALFVQSATKITIILDTFRQLM
jgi:hypothetical protein